MRKYLALVAVLALSLVMAYGALGSAASFTSTASALQNFSVGTFGCSINATQQGAQVVNIDGALGTHTVTYTTPMIMGSAASSAPLVFTVSSIGNIPVKVHISQTAPIAPFLSLMPDPVADVTLNNSGDSHEYSAGISWPELTDTDLGKTGSITWTANCIEASATYLPPLGTYTRIGNNLTIRVNLVTVPNGPPNYTIAAGDTMDTYCFSGSGWGPVLATADAQGVIYYTGPTTCPVGQLQVSVHGGPTHTTLYNFAAHL